MSLKVYPGGWYCDANDRGEVVLFNGSRLELRYVTGGITVIALPQGQNVLYPVLAPDGLRVAGQGGGGAITDRAMEWNATFVSPQFDGWSIVGAAPGQNPLIYDNDGWLHFPDATTGSQGWRYIDDSGVPVSSDATIADIPRRIWQYIAHGNVTVGQGGEGPNGQDPLVAIVNGVRRRVGDGTCRNIRFRRYGDDCVIAWWQQDRNEARVLRCTVAELAEFPVDTEPPPARPFGPISEFETEGIIEDTLRYVIGDPALSPRDRDPSSLDGHAMQQTLYPERNCVRYVKFGDPTNPITGGSHETWRWDSEYIYHWEDHSHRPYYWTDGRWLKRRWRIGEEISCETNQIQYYDGANTCNLSTRGGHAYIVKILGRWRRFWCGPEIGEREVILHKYDPTNGRHDDQNFFEHNFFALDAGWLRWESYESSDGHLAHGKDFYRVKRHLEVAVKPGCRALPPVVDNPDIPEPPVDEIPSLQPLVENVWHRYDGQDHGDPVIRGKMLNTIAWEGNGFNGAGPWFLSAKPAGSSAPQPGTGTPIAHDIVQYGQTEPDGHFNGFDVFTDTGPIWIEAGQHNQPSRVAVQAVNPAGAGGGGDEDDMTIDEHVQAMIDAATAPLVARIAALEAGGGTTPPPPSGLTLPLKVSLKSGRTGFYLTDDGARQSGHEVHAGVEDGRTGVGSWETWTLEKA